ncbi:STAS domain-containing protein [Mycobacterium sp. Lab-001]|uniref:STAS domain-containing protein n=1 Tax=Mycobacterium sp. Lab-001 TaxID=3410136 RepID=UPI003D1807DE
MATVSVLTRSPASLIVAGRMNQSVAVLTVDGVLDAANSAALRDTIVRTTRDETSAVVVDVNALHVPTESAWTALIGARWQLHPRAAVPIALVCAQRASRDAIERTGVARLMPVSSSENGAMRALGRCARHTVRRADAQLSSNLTSLGESRRLVREWLTAWSQTALLPVALVVVNVFVKNVLEHAASVPVLRVECDGTTSIIAVSDSSNAPAVRLPPPEQGIDVSGLAIVEALTRAWGSAATASGKTVWAVIGPENQL